jgi:hypothetical protein
MMVDLHQLRQVLESLHATIAVEDPVDQHFLSPTRAFYSLPFSVESSTQMFDQEEVVACLDSSLLFVLGLLLLDLASVTELTVECLKHEWHLYLTGSSMSLVASELYSS